jgi:hypothetical protein
MTNSIALLGEYTPTFPPHLLTNVVIDQTLFVPQARSTLEQPPILGSAFLGAVKKHVINR